MDKLNTFIISNPQILIEFKRKLIDLKTTLQQFDHRPGSFRPDMVANDFRKVLEAFIATVYHYSDGAEKNLYEKLLKIERELNKANYISTGQEGNIMALVKLLHTYGNLGSHHQPEEDKQIDRKHIQLCRLVLHELIEHLLADHLEKHEYHFLNHEPTTNKAKHILIAVVLLLSLSILGLYWLNASSKQVPSHLIQPAISEPSPKEARQDLTQVHIASQGKLKIVLEHRLSDQDLEKATLAAQTYALYRFAYQKFDKTAAFPAFTEVLKCFYSIPYLPRHEFFKRDRWKTAPKTISKTKTIYLRAAKFALGQNWLQLSVSESPNTSFGMAQTFVFEKEETDSSQKAKWLISGEYGMEQYSCAPRIRKGRLIWPKN